MITRDNSVVVMPTAFRPEMLAWALKRLDAAFELPEVHIFVDHVGIRALDDAEYARDTYLPQAHIHYAGEHTQCSSGTWNILNSIKAGYDMGADYVFLVEEDVMMYPDFMQRHRSQFANGEYSASCGRVVPGLYAKHGPVYTNPGSCLTRRLIASLRPHICEEYYAGTAPYIQKTFGRGPFNSSLDDGLVRMVCWQNNWMCTHANPPICAHQGFIWYNKLDLYMNEVGTLPERIEMYGKIAESIQPGDRYAKDFEPFKL